MKKIINNNTNLTTEGVRIKSLAQIAAYSPYEQMRHRAYDDLTTIDKMLKTIKRLTKENRELREDNERLNDRWFELTFNIPKIPSELKGLG